jgi:hypothetical protein
MAQPVWVLSLPVVAVLWSPWYLLTAALYGGAALAAGGKVGAGMTGLSWPGRLVAGLVGAGLTVTVHVCYGVGVIRGVFWRGRSPASEWQRLTATPRPSRLLPDP